MDDCIASHCEKHSYAEKRVPPSECPPQPKIASISGYFDRLSRCGRPDIRLKPKAWQVFSKDETNINKRPPKGERLWNATRCNVFLIRRTHTEIRDPTHRVSKTPDMNLM
jgi:hypothetical protein